jgi:hypothetical protein
LRPYLSKLGAELVAGIRRARLERATKPTHAAVVSVRTLPDGLELWPAKKSTVIVRGRLGFRVTVDAEGPPRSRTKVRLTLRQRHATIVRTATIESIAPRLEKSVVFSKVGRLDFGTRASLKVDLSSAEGGRNVVTDSAFYPVVFGRPLRLSSEGARGTGLVATVVLPYKQTLSKDTENTVHTPFDLALAVTIQNTGRVQERDVKVTLRIDEEPPPIIRTRKVNVINPGRQATVIFGSLVDVQYADRATIKVGISPVPGEGSLLNNTATYRVVFTL